MIWDSCTRAGAHGAVAHMHTGPAKIRPKVAQEKKQKTLPEPMDLFDPCLSVNQLRSLYRGGVANVEPNLP